MLQFATWCEPQDIFNPVNTYQPQRRAVVDTSIPDQWRCSWVPPANLAPGVVDEGTWPRFVLLDGQQILMRRDEWDELKLRRTHDCMIPQRGFPVAERVRGDVPELDSDSESDTSSEGTATPRAIPSSPATQIASLDDNLPPGSPMQSVVSRLSSIADFDAMSIVTRSSRMSVDTRSSKMSVDTQQTVRSNKTVRSNASSNLAPNAFGKRAKAPSREHPAERAAKRHHMMNERGRREALRAREQRRRQRQQYERERRIAVELAQWHNLCAEEALRREQLLLAEAHARELEEKRQHMAKMDAEERAARESFAKIELDRAEAAQAFAARRMQPILLPAQEAFELWQQRVDAFQRLRRVKGPLYIRDIPFPVLFRPEYSLHLVNEANVAAFFTACADFLTPDKLKSARVLLHPDHFGGRKYVAGENYEDEAQTAFVVDVMKVVSAYVNDNLVRH